MTAEAPILRNADRAVFYQTPGAGAETAPIGRAAEMDELRAVVDGAVAGAGRVVAVIGEAGISKSRRT